MNNHSMYKKKVTYNYKKQHNMIDSYGNHDMNRKKDYQWIKLWSLWTLIMEAATVFERSASQPSALEWWTSRPCQFLFSKSYNIKEKIITVMMQDRFSSWHYSVNFYVIKRINNLVIAVVFRIFLLSII